MLCASKNVNKILIVVTLIAVAKESVLQKFCVKDMSRNWVIIVIKTLNVSLLIALNLFAKKFLLFLNRLIGLLLECPSYWF